MIRSNVCLVSTCDVAWVVSRGCFVTHRLPNCSGRQVKDKNKGIITVRAVVSAALLGGICVITRRRH